MGDIPSTARMVSTIIRNPKHNDVIQSGQDITVQLTIKDMQLGRFTNAQETYYAAPQALAGQGRIVGHTHVTVQDMGNSLDPGAPLDPISFVFFKGINDNGDGNGNLETVIPGGLPAGF